MSTGRREKCQIVDRQQEGIERHEGRNVELSIGSRTESRGMKGEMQQEGIERHEGRNVELSIGSRTESRGMKGEMSNCR
eukprot:2742546-Pleurochrysis_carterae.AAC.1